MACGSRAEGHGIYFIGHIDRLRQLFCGGAHADSDSVYYPELRF
jgi:hypothetical protein